MNAKIEGIRIQYNRPHPKKKKKKKKKKKMKKEEE